MSVSKIILVQADSDDKLEDELEAYSGKYENNKEAKMVGGKDRECG